FVRNTHRLHQENIPRTGIFFNPLCRHYAGKPVFSPIGFNQCDLLSMGNGGIPTCCGSGHVFDEGSPNSIVLVNSILMHQDDQK
ncbi:hypothetical protein, partial [Acetobacter pasteurianus]